MPVLIPQWTKGDIKTLQEKAPTMSIRGIRFTYMPNRSIGETRAKAIDLGLVENTNGVQPNTDRIDLARSYDWKFDEVLVLCKYRPTLSSQEMHDVFLPDRTEDAITDMSEKLGILPARQGQNWEDIEIRNLIKHAPEMTVTELQASFFPDRTRRSITKKLEKLKIKAVTHSKTIWTPDEVKYLLENHGNIPIEDIAKKLNRTVSSVKGKLCNYKDNSDDRQKSNNARWTKEDRMIIQEFYKTCGPKEIRDTFMPHRTVIAIRQQASLMGLSK